MWLASVQIHSGALFLPMTGDIAPATPSLGSRCRLPFEPGADGIPPAATATPAWRERSPAPRQNELDQLHRRAHCSSILGVSGSTPARSNGDTIPEKEDCRRLCRCVHSTPRASRTPACPRTHALQELLCARMKVNICFNYLHPLLDTKSMDGRTPALCAPPAPSRIARMPPLDLLTDGARLALLPLPWTADAC